MLKDKDVDAVLVILTPQAMTDPTATASAVGKAAATPTSPSWRLGWAAACVAGGHRDPQHDAGVPTYNTPEKAVAAFMHLVSYARNLEILHETPRDLPLEFSLDRRRLRGAFATILCRGRRRALRERLEGLSGVLRDPRDPAAAPPAPPTRRSKRPIAWAIRWC